MLNRGILEKIIAENLELSLNTILSCKGYSIDSTRTLFRFISNIFTQIPPELIDWRFKVVSVIDSCNVSNNDVIHINNLKDNFKSECTIVMRSENTFVIDAFDTSFEGQACLSYIYHGPLNEQLIIGNEAIPLPAYYDSATSSIFAYPVYKELDEALETYDKTHAANSMCGVLKQVWKDDSKKEFCEKPEHFMRDSLWQYLRAVLRNHTVKREQIVDDSHPVDIKVTWPIISNVALIEIKWLGDSGATKYRDARANEGAKQLIDYLCASYEEEPDKNFIGYLTVFDGRRGRRCLNQYQFKEIDYKEEYLSHPKMRYYRFYLLECG